MPVANQRDDEDHDCDYEQTGGLARADAGGWPRLRTDGAHGDIVAPGGAKLRVAVARRDALAKTNRRLNLFFHGRE